MKSWKVQRGQWTPDREAALKRLWAEGKTGSQIAEVIGGGMTRNSVISKAHRMGLQSRPKIIKS
jgi:GcrA cell cycle regulator